MNRRVLFLIVFAGVLTLAGCAGSKNTASEPHPLAGEWSYSLDTPEGPYSGTIRLSEADGGMLNGIIMGDGLPGETALSNLALNDNKLTFEFDSGQYGVIGVDLNVNGDAFNGFLAISGVGELPIAGSRK